MRPTQVLLALMIVVSLTSAFTADKYLYSGEEITEEDIFTVDGEVYKLISVDGNATMLVSDNDLVMDESRIETVLVEHYTTLYFPSQEDIDGIIENIVDYNTSRNNGDVYHGMEEYTCRMGLFFHAFPCRDEETCTLSSYVICEEYGEYVGCMNPEDIYDEIKEFADATYGMDEDVAEAYWLLKNLTPSNIHENLVEVQALISEMEEFEEDIESTKFRLPEGGKGCNDCYGICPPMKLDDGELAEANDELLVLMESTAPLGDYSAEAEYISSQTKEREDYVALKEQQNRYRSIFKPQDEYSSAVLADADELLSHIVNSTVSTYADRVEVLLGEINASIESGNFRSVNSSMDELQAKTASLASAIPKQWEVYNSTYEAKGGAAAVLFVLETSSLSDEEEAYVASMAAKKRTLDRSLVKGLDADRYMELREDYANVTGSLMFIYENVQSTSSFTGGFKAAGKKTNEGLASLVTTIQPLDREQRDELSNYAPLVFTSVTFFSLASLFTFLFLFMFGALSHVFRKRMFLFAGLALLIGGIVLVGILSAGVYLVTKSTSTDSDFTIFSEAVQESDTVSILIDSRGATMGSLTQMRACADEVSTALSPKTVVVYERTNSACTTQSDSTVGDCYNSIPEPIINLQYSAAAAKPSFTTSYVNKALFAGDESYFEECSFAAMFSSIDSPPPQMAEEEESEES